MNIYAHNIMDHYKSPRNQGVIKEADACHRELNRSCGDDISVSIKLDGDLISDIKFLGSGCAISQAGISILSEKLLGKNKQEVMQYDFEYLKKILGVPISERRSKCALIGLLAIQNAILKTLSTN
jgi:nitrogen fixation NifU-like protein